MHGYGYGCTFFFILLHSLFQSPGECVLVSFNLVNKTLGENDLLFLLLEAALIVLYNSLQLITKLCSIVFPFKRRDLFFLKPHESCNIKEKRSTVQIYADSMTWICFFYPLTPVCKFVWISVVVNDMRFLRSRGQSNWISNIVGIFCPAASDTIGTKTNGCLYPTKSNSN